MKNIILIGGKSVLNEDTKIEEYILNLSGKNKPNILFFPTASKDDEKSINNFINQFKRFNVSIEIARLLTESNNSIMEKITNANVLYFGGGDTKILVEELKKENRETILKNIINEKIIVGLSAGANMIARYGMGDSKSYVDNFKVYNYKMVQGLGLLDITVCPHYQKEELICYNDIVSKYEFDGYALEDDTAIHFTDNNIRVIKSLKSRSVYKFDRKEKYIMKPLYEETNKIAVLGPAGTFSEVACKKYINSLDSNLDIEYYPTVLKTALAVEKHGIAILPFENTLDGYILETIDILIKKDYDIVCDLKTKVEFAFVSNAKDIKDVKNIFVQFKSKGQCVDFLTSSDYKLIITESNIESLENLKDCDDTYGAIIPYHKLSDVKFNTVVPHVEDKDGNYTRFVVITDKLEKKSVHHNIKCSLCIYMNDERPGLLFELLKLFSDNKLNMVSILSRPTKEELGKYNFYIELSVKENMKDIINKVVDDISKSDKYRVKNLGIYSSLD